MKYRSRPHNSRSARLLTFLFGAAAKVVPPRPAKDVEDLDLPTIRMRLEASGLWDELHPLARGLPPCARIRVDRADGRIVDWYFV